MRITEKRTQVILDALMTCEEHHIEMCCEYGEPGYSTDKGVILGNWNDGENPLNARSIAYLEAAGYDLEWSDEWMIEYNESKAYRTQADSYSWTPSAVIAPESCEWMTPDTDRTEVIEAFAIEDYAQEMSAVPKFVDPEDFENAGYVAVTDDDGDAVDYRSGWYGREDNPSEIARKLFDDGAESVAFQVTGSGQFEVAFTVYRKDADED